MPTYAVVHSTVSGMLRRVVADDDGEVTLGTTPDGTPAVICKHGDELGFHPLAAGESAIIMQAVSDNPADWKNAIRSKTGKAPPDITCALIDHNDVVTAVVMADPAVDDSPDTRLMVECYSPQIVIGCSYDRSSGLFTTPGGMIPPGAPGNDTTEPIPVPPAVIPKP